MATQNSSLTSYLREQRDFPDESINELANQCDQAYIDVATKVNQRTIGIYPANTPAVTGERWYPLGESQKQQSLRQIYSFTTTSSISHGINLSSVSFFSPLSYGSFTNGTNSYGLIFGSDVAILGQISFYISGPNIIFLAGAGAPILTKGIINLEWVSVF